MNAPVEQNFMATERRRCHAFRRAKVKANRNDSLERESQAVGVHSSQLGRLRFIRLFLGKFADRWESEHLTLQSFYHQHDPHHQKGQDYEHRYQPNEHVSEERDKEKNYGGDAEERTE